MSPLAGTDGVMASTSQQLVTKFDVATGLSVPNPPLVMGRLWVSVQTRVTRPYRACIAMAASKTLTATSPLLPLTGKRGHRIHTVLRLNASWRT